MKAMIQPRMKETLVRLMLAFAVVSVAPGLVDTAHARKATQAEVQGRIDKEKALLATMSKRMNAKRDEIIAQRSLVKGTKINQGADSPQVKIEREKLKKLMAQHQNMKAFYEKERNKMRKFLRIKRKLAQESGAAGSTSASRPVSSY